MSAIMKPTAYRVWLRTVAAGLETGPGFFTLAGLVGALVIGVASCGGSASDSVAQLDLFREPFNSEPPDLGLIEVEPPPFTEGVFPCTDCHEPDLPVKGTRRKLKRAHQDIVLAHDEENRWCVDCHSVIDFDKLHLADGELIDFEESHRLCGQCHGDKYRDWRRGVHGRRSGEWEGEKTYLLCVHCHPSHAPAFRPIAPKPPPLRPERTR